MTLRDLLNTESPLTAWFLITGALMWVFILGAAFMFALAGAVKVIHALVTEWLTEESPPSPFPWRRP